MNPSQQKCWMRLTLNLMNRALMCDKAGNEELATAHLEVAEKVMLEMAAANMRLIGTDGDE
jgi:hypothetical protein